jgi:hypothetical protein
MYCSLEIFFKILAVEIVYGSSLKIVRKSNFHILLQFPDNGYSMEIDWIYYGFSDAIANSIVFHYFF